MTEIIAAIAGALVGTLGGYAISRVCWARSVDGRLSSLEGKFSLLLDHFGVELPAEKHHHG